MYCLRRPTDARLDEILAAARDWPLQTPLDPLREQPDAGWNVDRYETAVPIPPGTAHARVRAVVEEVLHTLAFFPEWMIVRRCGDVSVVGAQALGLWGVFANRVVEERCEADDARGSFDARMRYATLRGHFETGVELFRAQRADAAAEVRFTIEPVSRAVGLWKRVVHRLAARGLQRRFGRDATARFARVVGERLRG